MGAMILEMLLALALQGQGQSAMNEFDLVCEKLLVSTSYSCDYLEPPLVIYTELVDIFGANGLWVHGEDIIFISPNLNADRTHEVIIHETIHYVLWMQNIIRSTCVSEEFAREWTAEITGVPMDETWWERYECEKS